MHIKKDFRIVRTHNHIKTKKPIKFNIVILFLQNKLKRKKNNKEINKTEKETKIKINNIR